MRALQEKESEDLSLSALFPYALDKLNARKNVAGACACACACVCTCLWGTSTTASVFFGRRSTQFCCVAVQCAIDCRRELRRLPKRPSHQVCTRWLFVGARRRCRSCASRRGALWDASLTRFVVIDFRPRRVVELAERTVRAFSVSTDIDLSELSASSSSSSPRDRRESLSSGSSSARGERRESLNKALLRGTSTVAIAATTVASSTTTTSTTTTSTTTATTTTATTTTTTTTTTTPEEDPAYEEVQGRRRIVSGSLSALVRALADANMPDQVRRKKIAFLSVRNRALRSNCASRHSTLVFV